MTWTIQNLWLIPALPLLAAGVSALLKQRQRALSATLAIGSMAMAFLLACSAFVQTLGEDAERQVCNFTWFQFGESSLQLGWVLDPLTAAMLVMVTFVSTLIFIYSVGYMAHDENFTRFFTFLSLFAAAMLGLVIANNLLLLFMCWELVGLASYLLIGFWYHKPSSAAAAKKAFITTRVGDVFFFLGLLWLYAETGTLLFYDNGNGCLEQSALMKLVGASIGGGMAVSTAIALLIFCGAVGKSGQVPLHVWLPDAMEGPTPVSALIHAATMVAAGVFLIARVFPLVEAVPTVKVTTEATRLTKQLAFNDDTSSRGGTASHGVAIERSPRREPWVNVGKDEQAPEGRQNLAPVIAVANTSLPPLRGLDASASETHGLSRGLRSDAPPALNGLREPQHPETRAQFITAANVLPLPKGEGRGEGKGTHEPTSTATVSVARQVVTWIGAITAVFAALVAVAQTDIKRILAYSTVSQLGFMFVGLGAGGVAVGMFHLLTHAFFKALLFLGAGSVIHGCNEEQDIRRMGGLRKLMPVTFATYAIGMMALSGFPLVFSGFWSKDEILHSAWHWQPSKWPFVLASFGALLTAFYMTRQMYYVFFGSSRSSRGNEALTSHHHIEHGKSEPPHVGCYEPHESPPVMTIPLIILAVFAVLLGFFGTPLWPWFQSYLGGHHSEGGISAALPIMLLSTAIFGTGAALGWRLYGRKPITDAAAPDPLEQLQPGVFAVLRGKFYIDELYEISVIRFNAWCARVSHWLDETFWDGAVKAVSACVLALSWLNRFIDEFVVNLGFDEGCRQVRDGAKLTSRLQDGQVQNYLRVIGLALTILLLFLIWGRG